MLLLLLTKNKLMGYLDLPYVSPILIWMPNLTPPVPHICKSICNPLPDISLYLGRGIILGVEYGKLGANLGQTWENQGDQGN